MNQIRVIPAASIDKTFSLTSDQFQLAAYHGKSSLKFDSGSVYVFVQSGHVDILDNESTFKIGSGHYFSRKSPVTLNLSDSCSIITMHSEAIEPVLNSIGGPIEATGRLKYIDGCSDTLLLSPVRLGEPCLNLLHFPKNTTQTEHNHPSFRFGIVTSGKGVCVTRGQTQELNTGDVFFIPRDVYHKFDTHSSSMNIIAFHPDSDWGPTDEEHPMINRTWINGRKI